MTLLGLLRNLSGANKVADLDLIFTLFDCGFEIGAFLAKWLLFFLAVRAKLSIINDSLYTFAV